MEWIKDKRSISAEARVPIKSWCPDPEPDALAQAANLAAHPEVEGHVALMPDCHVGYGMPIGGVIACPRAVIPNAVGVDIGCGMGAVRTSLTAEAVADRTRLRAILEDIKRRVPVGEGNSHRSRQDWKGFEAYLDALDGETPGWLGGHGLDHDRKNLGTLGGGNHFIELQADTEGTLWIMLHSGSRNLGYRVASHYHKLAQALNQRWHSQLPAADLAFLPIDCEDGQDYLRDMQFALAYAAENRRRMLAAVKEALADHLPGIAFVEAINIHHNYAAREEHFGRPVWVHRKGATAARRGELGIIPGSMGTSSYIVRGRGNPDSFASCSHGAGRTMGRAEASRRLTLEECDRAMEGIVFDRWHKGGGGKRRQGAFDFGEAPQAYKDIDRVIAQQLDLIEPLVKLRPLGVIKG